MDKAASGNSCVFSLRIAFRHVVALSALCLCVALPCVHGAGATSFPAVPLVNGSEPRYASLALDEKGERVMFVLFDGNAAAGYARAYLWIPDHPQYGRPVSVDRGPGELFPPVSVPASADTNVDAAWQLRAFTEERDAQAERMVKHHDYATGQTVERMQAAQEARRVPRFDFKVRYRHAGMYGNGVAGATDLLDIGLDGSLPVGTEWANRPAAFAPWNQLSFRPELKLQRSEDATDQGTIGIRTALFYHPGGPCRIASLPTDARVEFEIFPYMEAPLVAEAVPAAQALSAGFEAAVPFGWYQFRLKWTGEGITVAAFEREVFPFARQ